MEPLQQELEPYKDRLDQFAEQVRLLWPNWDYHNYSEHAVESIWEFLSLVEYERTNGVVVTTEEVVAGVLSLCEHDLANHWGEPYLAKYMEERASSIGSGIASSIGIERSIIKQKRIATMATRPGAKLETSLEKKARRADIANFAWEYWRFKDKTIKVWRESQKNCLANGLEVQSFSRWVVGIKDFVCNELLNEDLALGDFDRGASGQSLFHEISFDNFQALHDDMGSPDWDEPELYPLAA